MHARVKGGQTRPASGKVSIMRPRSTNLALKHMLAGTILLVACGCGGGPRIGNLDQPAGSPTVGHLPGFGNAKQDKQEKQDKPGPEARHVFCPEIVVLDGTAAAQFHAGTPPSNANLRYQYSLGEAARECSLDGDQMLIKVGIAGKVLLGPAGSPGSFNVPVRIAIARQSDNQPVVSKLYKASATIGGGETQADFTVVSEPLRVPFIQDHADLDYSIKVGLDTAGTSEKPAPAGERPDSELHRAG